MTITEPPICDHPLVAALDTAFADLRDLRSQTDVVWQFTDKERLELTRRVLALRAVVDASVLELIGGLERDQVTIRETGVKTTAWLRTTNFLSLNAARREVATGVALTGRFGATAEQLAAGEISAEQATAIARTLNELPPEFSADQVAEGEATILGFADTQGPRELERCSRHLLDVIAPELAEAKDAQRLARQEREARRTRYLRFGHDGHGAMFGRFKLTAADGEALRALIDAIAKRDRIGDDVAAEGGDMRTMEQRRADALMELTGSALRTGAAPTNGGDRPRVNLILDFDVLLNGLKAATLLDSDEQISAETARLLACDADLLPIVCNSRGQPLDVGTQSRFFTAEIRQALVIRDRGCAFPGCDVPPRDCDAHHLIPWWESHESSLGNGALLCRYHHGQVEPKNRRHVKEHEQWTMRMSLDGVPEVIPPAWVDPEQRPRRHHRYDQRD